MEHRALENWALIGWVGETILIQRQQWMNKYQCCRIQALIGLHTILQIIIFLIVHLIQFEGFFVWAQTIVNNAGSKTVGLISRSCLKSHFSIFPPRRWGGKIAGRAKWASAREAKFCRVTNFDFLHACNIQFAIYIRQVREKVIQNKSVSVNEKKNYHFLNNKSSSDTFSSYWQKSSRTSFPENLKLISWSVLSSLFLIRSTNTEEIPQT